MKYVYDVSQVNEFQFLSKTLLSIVLNLNMLTKANRTIIYAA